MTQLNSIAQSRISSHRDLVVWQRAMELAVECYRVARFFPPEERFGMKSQLQRAAVSVPANIAEGHGRIGTGDYVRGLSIARGSLKEVDCVLELGARVGLLRHQSVEEALSRTDEVGRILWVLIQRLGSRQMRSRSER